MSHAWHIRAHWYRERKCHSTFGPILFLPKLGARKVSKKILPAMSPVILPATLPEILPVISPAINVTRQSQDIILLSSSDFLIIF
jgi:hypothetical protein